VFKRCSGCRRAENALRMQQLPQSKTCFESGAATGEQKCLEKRQFLGSRSAQGGAAARDQENTQRVQWLPKSIRCYNGIVYPIEKVKVRKLALVLLAKKSWSSS